MWIAQRDGSAGRPGVAAQDGHEQFVVPLALPAESMPQASLKSEAALLVDPLGARIEVVDAKAHPEQTAGAQRVVDDQRVYEKYGFSHEGRLRDALRWEGKWHHELLMAILSSDPRPAN